MTRLRQAPVIRRILAWRWVVRAASVLALAGTVRPSVRFAIRELSGSRRSAIYAVRDTGARIVLRHNSSDVWTLAEIFYLHSYGPPEEVDSRLRALARPPRVLDLGANVGMYGALVLARFPRAAILAFEPDPANIALHRRCMAVNGSPLGWRLVEACAATEDGTRTFVARGDDTSAVTTSDAGTPVPARDVLPEMGSSDVVKMDVEGSEWELMGDPRFGAAPAIVVEYHPQGCPSDDPHNEAQRLLSEAGYTTRPVFSKDTGIGAVWAWK